MTNSNNLTKAQRRTQARRVQRAREAELRKTKDCEGGKGVKEPVAKVPSAPTFKGGLSAAERRALSRVQGLTQREIAEIRTTNNQVTVERLKVRAQRESAEKRKRMRRRQQNRRIFR